MGDEIDPKKFALAQRMMPLADETSQEILACSGFLELCLQSRPEPLKHKGNTHNDVTGIFTRLSTRRSRRKGRRTESARMCLACCANYSDIQHAYCIQASIGSD